MWTSNFFAGSLIAQRPHFISIALLLSMLVLNVFSCLAQASDIAIPKNLGPADFDHEVIDIFANSGELGVLTAFNANPSHRASRLQLSLHTKERQPIEFRYMIGNYTDTDLEYLIICLVDYKQHACSMNNHIGNSHKVTLERNQRIVNSFKIDPMTKGAHDLSIVAIRWPFNVDGRVDYDYRIQTHRVNIFIENDKFPEVEEVRPYAEHKSNFLPPGIRLLTERNVSESSKFDRYPAILTSSSELYVHVRNFHETEIRYACMIFSGDEQLDIEPNISSATYFFKLGADQSAALDVTKSINLADSPIWALCIENPFARLEDSYGTMSRINSNIYISNFIDKK